MKNSYEMTYDELVSARVQIQDRLLKFEKFRQCGIPKSLLRLYKGVPYGLRKSGYSMGGVTQVWCGSTLIDTIDDTRQYSGKYRGSETHGKLVYRFTKKALRQWFGILEKKYWNDHQLELTTDGERKSFYRRQSFKLYNEIIGLFEKAYRRDESVVKIQPDFTRVPVDETENGKTIN